MDRSGTSSCDEQSESMIKMGKTQQDYIEETDPNDSDLELSESDEHLTDGTGGEDNVESDDLDDIELIKECSREDLFMLIKDDPKYYCDLITKNRLNDELSIKIGRSNDGGGLNIKFRIYPEDRWTEVGYWGDRKSVV